MEKLAGSNPILRRDDILDDEAPRLAMARQRKIALVGARGYNLQSAEVRVSSYAWDRLNEIPNLSDFDTVILNLLSVAKEVDWNRFTEILNFHTMFDIVGVGGTILVIGDPRLRITGENLDEPFLDWTAAAFTWDNQPGDTIVLSADSSYEAYGGYLRHLTSWDYALRQCSLDRETVGQLFNVDLLEARGRRITLEKHPFAWNRYQEEISFSVNMVIQRNVGGYDQPDWRNEKPHGTITFLPKTSVSEDEAILIVLRDICGVEAGIPEPEWVAAYEAPSQDLIDAIIADIKDRIDTARDELKVAVGERTRARDCLKLLYERAQPLEVAVRAVLRELGGSVEDPKEAGKEDGWLSVVVGTNTYEGVLEVKSTKNEEFDQYGLRQLLDWINRGVELRRKKYKGIFVGSNSVDQPAEKRKAGFSDGWKKSAELHAITAIKADDLYKIYVLSKDGKLDAEAFWECLFNTDGVFDMAEFVPKEEKGPQTAA